MTNWRSWIGGLTLLIALSGSQTVHADVEGESLHTPNQVRRVTQVNHDLPTDLQNQPGDSPAVTQLRDQLRQAFNDYKQAAKAHGSGTPESRQAAHVLLEAQTALHKEFIHEEAIPAIASR